ncbi:PaaI family thioesterase [Rhodococcus sp. 1168]|uniref:PaaI family thioesterase n=1 Tax=Rhodococcus sp. 1168 TaxID=2018041 RepID=UPI000A0CC00B|nr:PaaI family thioesterase [Rhodococcus sp. 1168]ORI20640.1 thioesterase [Rhodococcus sp. 1168]
MSQTEPKATTPSATNVDPADITEMVAPGFDGTLGLEYLEVSGDRVRASWDVTPKLHQPAGIMHGGVLCAVVESLASIGGTVWLGDRGHVVGVNNNTDFLRATRSGRLTGIATPVHRGRTQQIWQVDISDEAGKLVAQGKVRLANIVDTAILGNAAT